MHIYYFPSCVNSRFRYTWKDLIQTALELGGCVITGTCLPRSCNNAHICTGGSVDQWEGRWVWNLRTWVKILCVSLAVNTISISISLRLRLFPECLSCAREVLESFSTPSLQLRQLWWHGAMVDTGLSYFTQGPFKWDADTCPSESHECTILPCNTTPLTALFIKTKQRDIICRKDFHSDRTWLVFLSIYRWASWNKLPNSPEAQCPHL